jgi:hypothetical protein
MRTATGLETSQEALNPLRGPLECFWLANQGETDKALTPLPKASAWGQTDARLAGQAHGEFKRVGQTGG